MSHLNKLQLLDHMTDRFVYARKHAVRERSTKTGMQFTFSDGTKYKINYGGRKKEEYIRA